MSAKRARAFDEILTADELAQVRQTANQTGGSHLSPILNARRCQRWSIGFRP